MRRPGAHQRRSGTAASRNEEALVDALYDRYAAPLLSYVIRLTGGDRQRAEDIVQETLLRAWRNAHKLAAADDITAWLVTVARRIAIDNHRSDRSRPPETYDLELDGLPSGEDVDRALLSITVTDALRSLSHAHREILLETYFRGRTVAEAADELGLPLGTAKSRLYYGLRALRDALAQRGVTDDRG